MLWAIDVGNTQSVFGLHDGQSWKAVWRLQTTTSTTEDELASTLKGLCDAAGLPFKASNVVIASVVPAFNASLVRLGEQWLGCSPKFLRSGREVGIDVKYQPPDAVGADRIANTVAALARWKPPIIVIDLGTATTFDAIDADGAYVGGAILPGVMISVEALFQRTAKLPQIELAAPTTAIGQNTPHAMQSGIVFGYASAIDGLVNRISTELGPNVKVVATGGLGGAFTDVCQTISEYDELLTLEGLRLVQDKLS